MFGPGLFAVMVAVFVPCMFSATANQQTRKTQANDPEIKHRKALAEKLAEAKVYAELHRKMEDDAAFSDKLWADIDDSRKAKKLVMKGEIDESASEREGT